MTLIRKATVSSLLVSITVFALVGTMAEGVAQTPDYPIVEMQANQASERRVTVQAKGEHDVQSSDTLRARGCVGFVDDSPAMRLVFHNAENNAAPVIRAESAGGEDLVLLVGSANQGWYCNNDTHGTDPEIRLPTGSRTYSVWVGLREGKGEGSATVRLRVDRQAGGPAIGAACGEAGARIPQGVSSEDWRNYSCESATDAGPRWNLCLPRPAYSDSSEDGCPGAERCCPPPGFSPAVSTEMQGVESGGPVSGMCGEASARRPKGVSVQQWSEYSCQAPGNAGSRWTLCLPRAAYSDDEADGCPGIERCCPPEGFDPQASASGTPAEQASHEATTADVETGGTAMGEIPPPRRSANDPPPLRRAESSAGTAGSAGTSRPSGETSPSTALDETSSQRDTPASAASAQPSSGEREAVAVGTHPWRHISETISLVWRGFATTIPAHADPDPRSALVFDFAVDPGATIRVERHRLLVTSPRKLRARESRTLTDRVSGASVVLQAGDEIQLVAAVDEHYCTVLYGGRSHEVLCPTREGFRGVNEPFVGIIPEAFRWYAMVESPTGERGWVEIRTASPLFDLVIPAR